MNRTVARAAATIGLLASACSSSSAPPAAPSTPTPHGVACQPSDCGPRPAIARLCGDGSTGTPQCGRASDGSCAWEHICPNDASGEAGTDAPSADQAPAPPEERARPGLDEANAAFAQHLYGRLASKAGNLFFSPASVSIALAMTYAGARGETAAQMAKALEIALPPEAVHPAFAELIARLQQGGDNAPEVHIASRLWGPAGMSIEPDFLNITRDRYGAAMELVDFTRPEAARARINTWVEDKTARRIKSLFPPRSLTGLTRLVLTNAVYFKGRWAAPFDRKSTQPEPFTVRRGAAPRVPTMHKTLRARYGETDDASLLEIPYQAASPDRAFAMLVLLPKADDGLAAVEQALAAGRIEAYVAALGAPEQVKVALPRFKVVSEHDLAQPLAAMGMPLAFDPEKADFSGISRAERLFLSQVRHKAFVDVNEEGTEAAAATGVAIATRAIVGSPKVFRADHPFAFLIREPSTGTVLFMGRVADPR